MGRGECGKVNTNQKERVGEGPGRQRAGLGRLGVTARMRKACPGQGRGPKGNRWVCSTQALLTPALETVPVLQCPQGPEDMGHTCP